MVYVPLARKFKVHMDKVTGPQVKAWWFNPRDGKATALGGFEHRRARVHPARLRLVLDRARRSTTPRSTSRFLDSPPAADYPESLQSTTPNQTRMESPNA